MPGIHGRIHLTLPLCLGFVLLCGVGWYQVGDAWAQPHATLQDFFPHQPLSEKDPPAAEAEPAGRNATPEQAEALDRTVEALLRALTARDAGAVQALCVAGGGWDVAAWAALLNRGADVQRLSDEAGIFGALLGHGARLAEVKTWGSRGVARIVVTLRPALWAPLVRQDGQWRLEVQSAEQGRAAGEVAQQLGVFRNGDMTSLLMLMDVRAMTGLPDDLLALMMLAPAGAKHEIVGRKVDGDRAWVRVEGQVEVHLAAPLERTRTGWHLPRRPVFLLIKPDEPLTPALAQDRSGRVALTCIANLKCLGLAMIELAHKQDAFPAADRWATALLSSGHPNENVLTCPAVSVMGGKWGYAMNYRLSRLDPERVTQPESTVMLFDSSLLQANAYDRDKPAGASATVPTRHDDVINYVFVDGHSASYRQPLGPEYFRPVRTKAQLLKVGPSVAPGGG